MDVLSEVLKVVKLQGALFYNGEFSEFTGPNFSPDGSILFVNIQEPGITLAITGPWERYLG